MKTIDARGQLCPAPLILVKRALKEADSEEHLFEVILDNQTAQCNVLTMLQEMGCKTITHVEGRNLYIRFSTSDLTPSQNESAPQCAIPNTVAGGYAVVLKSTDMGSGDAELGAILMRGCINSLSELDRLPSIVILYNSGVKLAIHNTDTAISLGRLVESGVRILLCGMCVDYYQIKDQLGVGEIVNMLKINTLLSQATHVIYP